MESLLVRKQKNKKGAGLILGLVMGVVALVIAVIIGFVVVKTIVDAEIIDETSGSENVTVRGLVDNMSAGVQEVSSKVPTVLLIAAVVLILGVLVFLWAQYQRMNIGKGGGEI